MKKSLLAILVASLASLPLAGLAENSQQPSAPAVGKASAKKATSKKRLGDAELDKVYAGSAEHTTGGGLTIISNPGNADVFNLNKRGHLLCVNC